jgi:hypothetical protein
MATNLENVGNIPAAWPIIFVGVPSFTRGRVVMYFITRPDRATGARIAAGVFCDHCFDCHLLSLTVTGRIVRAWPPYGHALII